MNREPTAADLVAIIERVASLPYTDHAGGISREREFLARLCGAIERHGEAGHRIAAAVWADVLGHEGEG